MDAVTRLKLLGFFALVSILSLPVLLPWGWVRWARRKHPRSVCGILSLIAFAFGSSSSLLAIYLAIYARVVGPFDFYDPVPMRFYGFGLLLSLAGFGFAIGGFWKANPLRWHAPACAVGTFLYWFFLVMSE